ncbi:hypothetical protein IJ579_01540 [bacterium]|nr:hypothetical protein [bacterium]
MLNNLNRYNNRPAFGSMTANFGMNPPQANTQVTNPAMGAVPMDGEYGQAIVEAASDNFIGNRIKAYDEVDRIQQFELAVPVVVAMNAAMDKYLKLYDGNYAKSLPGRIGEFGDRISEFFTENPIAKFFKPAGRKIKDLSHRYIYNNSGILRSLNETPSEPELKMVKHQMHMGKGSALSQCVETWEKFLEPLKSARDLDALGADAATITRVENLLKTASSAEQKASILLGEQFRLLNPGATATEIANFLNDANREIILKELKAKALGLADLAELEAIKKAPQEYYSRIIECLENTNKKFFARIDWSDKNLFTKFNGFLTGRKLSFQQVKNIIISSAGKENTVQRTALGRTLTKWVNLVTEGATNRLYAGKMAAFIQAFFLAEALIMANKQETTGDKIKSAAERITELIGFFVFMPPSIKLMHKIGGLQYSGMTPDQVRIYREAVKEFNQKVMSGALKDKALYKAEREILRGKFRPKTRNPITWLGRKVGDIITVGLEQVRPYTCFTHKEVSLSTIFSNPFSKSAWGSFFKAIPHRLKDFICNPKYWTKQMLGWPMRFALPMLIIMPFFNKLAVKACHAIVGKPKYSILDQSKFEREQEQAQNPVQTPTQTPAIPQIPRDPNSYNSDTNLIKIHSQNGFKYPEKNTITETTEKTQETIKDPKKADDSEPIRTYIPDPTNVVAKENTDTSAFDKAMADADRAEKEIQSIMSSLR